MHGSEWEGRSVTTFSTPNSMTAFFEKVNTMGGKS